MSDLVVVQQHPFNAETPLHVLTHGPTPSEHVFVRSHFEVPQIDPASFRLVIDGEVGKGLVFSLAELQSLPSRTVELVFECSGNGRGGLGAIVPGVPWGYGAVSRVQFTGVPLSVVLRQAGIALEILGGGADGDEERFARSLPLAVAMAPDTLLAWSMNGEALRPEHGFPLRLVVPRWYAMASVKWLTRLTALDQPYEGRFQTDDYVYRWPDGRTEPVREVRVRSLITNLADNRELGLGPVEVRGIAWSGSGAIRSVMLSDGSGRLVAAELTPPDSPLGATEWRASWTPLEAGEYVLSALATDSTGARQPLVAFWNEKGYGNNAVQRVHVRVVAKPSRRGVPASEEHPEEPSPPPG